MNLLKFDPQLNITVIESI